MHAGIQKALLKQKIKRTHGLILKEEASLYSTFVEPFTDALSAIKLGTQEILSATKLAWDTVFTLSPEKINAAREEFEQRQSEINSKWKPLMDKNKAALDKGDFDLIALAFAPGVTLAAAAGTNAVAAAGGVGNYLNDSGWKIPLLNSLPNMNISVPDLDLDSGSRSGGSSAPPKKEKSLLKKLAGLFYIESSWIEGDLILEDSTENKQAQPKVDSGKKGFDTWLNATGVAEEFKKTSEELYDMYQESISPVAEESSKKLKLLSLLVKAENLDQFMKIADEAKNSGVDLEIDSAEIEKKVSIAAEKLSKNEEYENAKSESEENSKTPEANQPSEDQLEQAKKTVFLQMKKDFDDKSTEMGKKLKDQTLEYIESYMPSEKSKKILNKTPDGIKFLKIFSDAKLSLENV